MCGSVNRIVALEALRAFHENEIARLGAPNAGVYDDEVRERSHELAMVNDLLATLRADPRLGAQPHR